MGNVEPFVHGIPSNSGQSTQQVEFVWEGLDVVVIQVQQLQAGKEAERSREGVDVVAFGNEDLQAAQALDALSDVFQAIGAHMQEIQFLQCKHTDGDVSKTVVAEVQLPEPRKVGKAGGQLGKAVVRQAQDFQVLAGAQLGWHLRQTVHVDEQHLQALQEADFLWQALQTIPAQVQDHQPAQPPHLRRENPELVVRQIEFLDLGQAPQKVGDVRYSLGDQAKADVAHAPLQQGPRVLSREQSVVPRGESLPPPQEHHAPGALVLGAGAGLPGPHAFLSALYPLSPKGWGYVLPLLLKARLLQAGNTGGGENRTVPRQSSVEKAHRGSGSSLADIQDALPWLWNC